MSHRELNKLLQSSFNEVTTGLRRSTRARRKDFSPEKCVQQTLMKKPIKRCNNTNKKNKKSLQESPLHTDGRETPHKNTRTKFSSSGKVEYAITNFAAFFEKESVHKDFHPLMDFLKHSPLGYALTASPIIYAEIVDEMWSKADCSTEGEIKFRIKGKSYTLTSTGINEALHLPISNFEDMPTDDEIQSMLTVIKYASSPRKFSEINRKFFRKEWSHFFDTLNKAFAGKSSWYQYVNTFVLKIAYGLICGRRIDIGGLLLKELANKLDDKVNRSKVIYYARFLMIIANCLCKEFGIDNRDDTLEVCVQTKNLFSRLVTENRHAELKFVLPKHIQVVLQTQSQSGRKATSVSQTGKRKKPTLHTITEDGNEANRTAIEGHPPQKKKDAGKLKSGRNLLVVDQEMPPADTNNALSALEPHPLPVEEKPKCDLLFLLEPALELNDRQRLMNAASVLKSQFVACLTCNAHILSTENMISLADKCYNTLRKLGDNSTSFNTEVNKLIAQHQVVALEAKKNKNFTRRDIQERYVQQVMSLSDATKKLSCAQNTLLAAKSDAASLKSKIEELSSELLKLTEELSEERERVKTLTAEINDCKEGIPAVKSELGKLEAEKEAVRVAVEGINDRYYAGKKEFENLSNQLLGLVSK